MKHNLIIGVIMLALISCNQSKQKTDKTNVNLEAQTKEEILKNTDGAQMFTTPDGVKLRYKVSGTGAPCLYIHGGPGQGFDSFDQMKGNNLQQKLTMIYLDQRGSGASGKGENYHIDALLNDFEALRKHLKIEKFYILAHSFGGILATAYTGRYPQHVEGLMLANCTLHFFNMENTKEQIAYADSLLQKKPEKVTINPDSLLPIFIDLREQLSDKRMGYRFITDDVNSIIKMEDIDANHPRINDFGMAVIMKPQDYPEYYKDYAPRTKDIKVPTLVISGRRDYAVGTQHYKTFQFPNQITRILNGGHLLYYENNENFIKTIFDFVENQSAKQ